MDAKTLKESFTPEKRPAAPAPTEARELDLPEAGQEKGERPEVEHPAAAEPTPVAEMPRRTPAPTTATTIQKDRILADIEGVLSDDLTDLFLKLSPEAQREFKARGEETAGQIRQLLEQAKINVKVIFELIKKWLKTIPGVNKFFLEQEAKIKTDKILVLAQEERRRAQEAIA